LDEDGNPLIIDAFNPTVRYDETFDVLAEEEGAHELRLINSDETNAESSGALLAIAQLEVLPPLRISSLPVIMGILLVVQLLGLIFAYLFGPVLFTGLADRLDTKRSIFLALCAYAVVSVWGFFLNSVIEFWFLAFMVAIVQGGSQALSRSLYATLSPKSMSGEFFGLFSIMSRFASVISPIVFVVSVALFASSRPGVLSLVVFFLVGMFLLSRVNVAEGTRVAQEKDAALLGGNVEH
jgi:MFS-type transporter involved in bile tolerance (Atg22 family)